jgi:hypothetical protein
MATITWTKQYDDDDGGGGHSWSVVVALVHGIGVNGHTSLHQKENKIPSGLRLRHLWRQ